MWPLLYFDLFDQSFRDLYIHLNIIAKTALLHAITYSSIHHSPAQPPPLYANHPVVIGRQPPTVPRGDDRHARGTPPRREDRPEEVRLRVLVQRGGGLVEEEQLLMGFCV